MSTQLAQNKPPVIATYLERFKDQIAAALPRHLTADRMSRIVMTEIRKVPALTKCDPKSLFGAVIQSSQLGLEPGSALGHAYLLPYGKQVQLIIGYRGMIALSRRSGEIRSIEARAVHANDEFSYSFGLTPDLKHVPAEGDRGELTHVYAVAHLRDGGVQWDVMSRSEIEEVRKQSKAARNGPWVTHFIEMAKKTVIRRLFKYLPVSIEAQTAVTLDEQAEAGVDQKNDSVISGEFTTIDDVGGDPEPETKVGSVKEKLRKKEGETIDAATGEIKNEDDGLGAAIEDEIVFMIDTAENSDSLDKACDMIKDAPKAAQDSLVKAAQVKRKALAG